MPKLDFKKTNSGTSEDDELDLDGTGEGSDELDLDGTGEGSDEETEESDSEDVTEEEKVNPEAEKKGRPKKNVDTTEDVEKELDVNPTDKIGDLLEDRRFALRTKALLTREYLAKQSLVQTMIPRSENEAKDASQYYNINGFAFYVRKGVFQKVPIDVAQMISDTYGQDAALVANHPLNLNNNVSAAKEFSR